MITDTIDLGIFLVDRDARVTLWNRFMERHSGVAREQALGRTLFEIFPELSEKWLTKKLEGVFLLGTSTFISWEQRPYLFRFPHRRPITSSIDAMRQNCTFFPIIEETGKTTAACITITDATDICQAHGELKQVLGKLTQRNQELSALNEKFTQAHQQLLQSEKLAAIGQLAAGVAHEINNPVGFVLSNLNTLARYATELLEVIDAYIGLEPQVSGEIRTKLVACRQHADLDYLQEDIPALLRESKDGLVRVRDIVIGLRDFSRVDSTNSWEVIDIHQCIESTLHIVHNEVKYRAELVREYDQLPGVECIPSQINQVILNLVINAAQACGEVNGVDGRAPIGKIIVRTGTVTNAAESVWFEVEDNGCGISTDSLTRIFEPFYTTKPVGQGTGLGLSVTYGIVTAHHGNIDVDSAPGRGTRFRVTLPLVQGHVAASHERG